MEDTSNSFLPRVYDRGTSYESENLIRRCDIVLRYSETMARERVRKGYCYEDPRVNFLGIPWRIELIPSVSPVISEEY